MISIHAPRVGRDDMPTSEKAEYIYFNPRAPCGARHKPLEMQTITALISIHAPRVGRDRAPSLMICRESISIHAPRVGRDHQEK